ncbi:MAG: hypothetical protein VX822_01040 [Candidatus Neomarinimicrobiota bacterium]|nr:hypothetical protein [Candidatus Neomarinimicrobiota bacterium]
MKKVAILTRDFQLGTRIAESVALDGNKSFFPDFGEGGDWSAEMVIVDLDDDSLNPTDLIRQIKSENADAAVVGTSHRISKALRSTAIDAGCSWVFTKSSLPKNLSSVLESIK